MQQPSPQGIASLYMGNPAALRQRVQKDQQAKPGLPPDLKQLMALNIVTNEADAAKRQQAMNALNSMAPAGQEPPTVAQSLQAQAKQKLQAQMLQQQRQQQGLQALAQQQSGAGEVPEGTQFAQAQPQGIDELPVEMGLAGGGIVAFAGGEDVRGYETPYDRMNRENREEAERRDREEASRPVDPQVAADRAALAKLWGTLTAESERAGRAIADIATLPVRGVVGAYDTAVVRPMRAAGVNAAYLSPKLTPEGADVGSMTPFTDVARARDAATEVARGQQDASANRALLSRADAGLRSAPAVAGTSDAAPSPRRKTPPGTAGGAPATAPAATPAQSLEDLVKARKAMADAERDAEMARYGKFMPRPDTSQYDRLIAELEGRKQKLNAPTKGMDAFMELMGQISAAGPQRTWYEAGAKGAAGQTALNKDREAKQFELTKQAIEVAQKKIDADRAYNKELYATGADAAKRTAEIVKETATEMGLDKRNAATLANNLKTAEIHAAATRYSADARTDVAGSKDIAAAEAAFARNPEAAALKKSLEVFAMNPSSPNYQKAVQRLAEIRASVYKQFGLTLEGAPGASGPGGTTPPPGAVREVKR